MSSPPRRLPNGGIMRSSTQPAISYPIELANYNALANLSPIRLHDDSGIESHNEPLHQPHLFGSQRNLVQSLQTIPHPTRSPQLNSMIFRQSSMRGSRMLQFASIQEVPEPNPYEQVRLPSRTDFRTAEGGVIIPIERLDEESRTEGTTPTNQPGSQNGTGRQEEHNEQQQQPDSQDQRIKRAARFRVFIQFFFNMLVLLCYTMVFLWMNHIIPVNVVFGIAFGLIVVAFAGPISKKGIYSDFDNMDTFFSIIHLTCLSVYAIIAFLKVNGVGISLTQFALLGMLVLFCSCCKNSVDEPSASKAILLIGKVFLWIQLLAVAIKVDGLPIPWSTIFIPTYFVLVLLTFSSTLIIMGSLFAFFNIMREEGVSAELVVGSVWYILNALYTVVWLLVMAGLTDILDYGAETRAFKTYLMVGMIHSGVLMLFTLLLWKVVLKFQEFEVQSEMLIAEDDVEVEGHEGTSVPNTRIRFQVSKDDKTHLAMISSTFYTYLEKHMQNNTDANNPSAIKKEIQQSKMRKKSNGLALTVPHHTDITPTRQNNVASPERKVEGKNLDFSEGDIKINIPPPEMKREESNRSTDNSCIVCYDSAPNAVFMDCGHGGVCYECALETWKKSDNCLFCRHPINKILKIVHCKPLGITKVVESTTKVIERV